MKCIGIVFLSCVLFVSAGSAQFRRALFLHHSVGLCFWDRTQVSYLTPPTTIPNEVSAYNSAHGLSGDQAVSMDEVYGPIGPALPNAYQGYWWRWAQVFSGHDPWGYSLDQFYGDYPVIVIKTGYPTTQYTRNSDSVEACKANWRSMLSAMRNHPNTFFFLWTGYPAATDGHSERAAFTNEFVQWATDVLAAGDDSFGPLPDNVHIFDAFHVLASSSDGFCDPIYGSESEGLGDHPSNEAVAVFTPIFVNALFDAAIAHEDGALPLTWGGTPSVIRLPSGHAQVEWTTLSEIHTWMFYLQKKERTAWRSIDSVHGAGNSVDPRRYVLRDPETTTGSVTYRLKEVDLDRSVHVSESVTLSVTGVPLAVAFENAMDQNYPNPFNPTTTIRFRLAEQANVKLELYNILGERVKTLREGVHPAGVHEVVVDARTLPSGVYYYTLSAGRYVDTKRLVLIR